MPDAVGQPDARPVWPDAYQRDLIDWAASFCTGLGSHDDAGKLRALVNAWDDAPANPAEAVQDALEERAIFFATNAVLAALGYPGTGTE